MNIQWFYTNPFAVKNRTAFAEFCLEHQLVVFEEEGHYGCFHEEKGLSMILPNCTDERAFLLLLVQHLQPTWVGLVVDASVTEREHCNSSWQITYAVNAAGEMCTINPHSIFEQALALGKFIAPFQDMVPSGSVNNRSEATPVLEQRNWQETGDLIVPRAIVEDVAASLCHSLVFSLPSQKREDEVARLLDWERQAISTLGALGRRYELRLPKELPDWLKVLIRQVEEQESREHSNRFETFSTRCPYCGQQNCLLVIEATLVQTNQGIQPHVPLFADRFDIYPLCDRDLKDLSTENEGVRCTLCGTEFDLSELILT